MSWSALQFGSVKIDCQTVALDMSVSVEQAESEWYAVADQTTYAPKITAYRERFEALRIQEETGRTAPPIRYVPESTEIVETAVEADPELRFPKLRPLPDPEPEAIQPEPPTPTQKETSTMPTNPNTATQAEIGARLREARTSAGWSRAALEASLDMPSGTLYGVESGLVKKWVPAICEYLRINPDWVATGEGERFTSPAPAPPPGAPKGGTARKAKIRQPAASAGGGKLPPEPAAQSHEPKPASAVPLPPDPIPAPVVPPIPPPLPRGYEMQDATLRLDSAGKRVVAVSAPVLLTAAEMDRVQKWIALQFLVA